MSKSDIEAKFDAYMCAAFSTRMAARSVTRVYDEALRPLDLKITQFGVLAALSKGSFESTTEMAEFFGMERSSLSRNLKVLAKRNLIDLPPSGGGAPRPPTLTPAGCELLNQAKPMWVKAQDKIVKEFTQDWPDTWQRLRELAKIA